MIIRLPIHILFLLLGFQSKGQGDTLLSKVKVDLKQLEIWSTISYNDKLLPEFEHIENLTFFKISYNSEGNLVKGFLIEPKRNRKHPVIIFNRGGNRDFGSLNLGTMINYTSKLAAEGYVIVASNYREKDEFGGAEINDVLKLIDIGAAIPKADTNRIGMFGWSRGGMMCYLAMAKTDRLKTVVVGNGPSDLFSTLEERPGLEQKVFSQCIPEYWMEKESALKERSVIHWVDKLNPPTSLLILAGSRDNRVSHDQAIRLTEKLKATKVRHDLKVFDTDHFFSDKKELLNQELINWFTQELKP